MWLASAVLAIAAIHGSFGFHVDSGVKPVEQENIFQEWMKRVEILEVKVKKMDELEARVQHLEALVRGQNARARSQSRKLALLEQLLKRPTTTQSETKDPPEESTDAQIDTDSSNASGGGDSIPSTAIEQSNENLRHGHQPTVRRGIRAAAEGGVAFSVKLDHDVGPLGEHQVVVFNQVQFNEGNGYNKYTGSFICPRGGVYLFLYNMGHQGIGQTWLQLMVNGKSVNYATVQTSQTYEENQGGNSVIVRLAPGDTVWIEGFVVSNPEHDNTLDGHDLLTTFSGILVY